MEQESQAEIQNLQKAVEQTQKNKEKQLKNIKCYTSCPKQYPELVKEREVREDQAKKRCDELVHSLRNKIKALKDGLTEEAWSSAGKERQLTKRRRIQKRNYSSDESSEADKSINEEVVGGEMSADNVIEIDDSDNSYESVNEDPDSDSAESNDDDKISSLGDSTVGGREINSEGVIEIDDSNDDVDVEKNHEMTEDAGDSSSSESDEDDQKIKEGEQTNPGGDDSFGTESAIGRRGGIEGADGNNYNLEESSKGGSETDAYSIDIDDPDDGNTNKGNNDESDDDLNYNDEMNEISKIRESKLTMAIQGFKSKSREYEKDATRISGDEEIQKDTISIPYDPETITHHGQRYYKGRCYKVKVTTRDDNIYSTVGILRFLQEKQNLLLARCVLIVPFEHTQLGMEDDDVDYVADYKPSSHVQVHQHVADLPITDLETESEEIKTIPSLIYEPQGPGSGCWQKFGYFFDKSKVKRRGRRRDLKILDIFVGAGGMHQGYRNAGFKTVKAVDNDKSAIQTLAANYKGISVYEGDAKDLVQHLDTPAGRNLIGRIDHVHVSPPCQGFSGANRYGGPDDLANNELSMSIVDFVRVTKCTTAVFENVLGMWRRKHLHYVKNIVKELLKLGYQIRCASLKACDYGDPQKRPRFFIFVSHKSCPPPSIPKKTHGDDPDLLPFVTVKDALSHLQNSDGTMPNMNGKTTTLQPGEHGVVRLDANGLAPTIRASSVPPFHYDEDRCINVREAASLQSFPVDYMFHGDLRSQYRQVGNAVPVELATAVAQSIRQILVYEYEEVD